MIIELAIIAGVQIGTRYFSGKHNNKRILADLSVYTLDRNPADLVEVDSGRPLVSIEPITPKKPHGLALSIATLFLASVSIGSSLALLCTAAISYAITPIYEKARISWRDERKITNDTLFFLFSGLALVAGYNVAIAFGLVAYELGSYLTYKTTQKTQRSAFNCFNQLPRSVWLLEEGCEVEVSLSEVSIDQILVVRAGEIIPVDGQIIKGQALVDQHQLTGEAQPVEKMYGDMVLASTMVTAGSIQVRITKKGKDTNIEQIVQTVTQVALTKTETLSRGEQLADLAAIPTLTMAGIALLSSGLPMAIVMLNSSFGNRIRILGPLSTLNYLTIAAQRGILIKSGSVLERLSRVDTVLFDKTGTLTLPQLKTGVVTSYYDYDEQEILAYAAAAERWQKHPIAKAILQKAQELQLDVPECEDGEYLIGFGVMVKLIDGKQIRLGSARYMISQGVSIPLRITHDIERVLDTGESVVVLAINGRVVGTITIQAQVRPEVPASIAKLRERGISYMAIISGDNEEPTRNLSESLGLNDYFAEVLPIDKANIVKKLQDRGRIVCFVGDGVNDSVAMQQADVSISLSGASTIATDSASVVLMDESLKHLCEVFDIAQKLNANVQRSLGFLAGSSLVNIGGAVIFGLSVNGSVLLKAVTSLAAIGNSALPLLEIQSVSKDDQVFKRNGKSWIPENG